MKKHVLFIRSNPVDADSRVQKEVCALLGGGYEVSVLGWDRDADYPIRKESVCFGEKTAIVYRVGIKSTFGGGIKKNLLPLLKFQMAIRNFLKHHCEEFSAIHACDFDTAFVAFHTVDRKKIKFVYDIFDYYVEGFQVPPIFIPIVKALDHAVINGADAVIICTEQRKEQIADTKPKKLVVIHNTPPKTEMAEEKCESSKVKVAYFGILSKGRMLEELLEVIAQNDRFELRIGGFGVLEDLVKQYAQENENIIFYGKLPYNEVLRYENQCHIMTAIYDPTVTNHIYAAPNKFYEALMLGKPLIMVKGTGMSKVIEENPIGVLIDYNMQSFHNALEELKDKRLHWPEMASKMKELYKSYSWDKMEERLLQLYASLTE